MRINDGFIRTICRCTLTDYITLFELSCRYHQYYKEKLAGQNTTLTAVN